MDPLNLVALVPLMERTRGRPEIAVGLIDGPVAMSHPCLAQANIREVPGAAPRCCARAGSAACLHGTFVAGVLSANRGSPAPAICPECTLLVRPLFAETTAGREQLPVASPRELAAAIVESVAAGARVINVSAALAKPSTAGERELEDALDYAARRGLVTVAAAGNQGTIGSSAITRHAWVIPVAACDLRGKPMRLSNLGGSIGRRGLRAPGDGVTSLGPEGKPLALRGTSVAAPFVTGTIALLWSEFPRAPAAEVRCAVTESFRRKRNTIVPPMLDAWRAYRTLAQFRSRRRSPVR